MAESHRKSESPAVRPQVHIPGPILLPEAEEAEQRLEPRTTETLDYERKRKAGTARAPATFQFQAHFDPAVQFLRTLEVGRPATHRPQSHRCTSPDQRPRQKRQIMRAFVHCSSTVTVLDQLTRPLTTRKSTRSVRRLQRSTREDSPEPDTTLSLCVGRDLSPSPPPVLPKSIRAPLQPTVMEYYRRLSTRPEHGSRTPATHQKRVASRGGYRTKLQKDPVLRRSALGRYEYKDCYDLDEVYLRKMHRAVNARRAGH